MIGALERLAADEPELATVTVVHHVEDIPACATHALLLREGASVAQGPIATALTPATLSAAFGLRSSCTAWGGGSRRPST